MTPAAEILGRLSAAGLHLRAEGGKLIARPKEAVTDDLRGLMRDHKAELLAELETRPTSPESLGIGLPGAVELRTLEKQPAEDPMLSPLSGLDCSTCANLGMRQEWHTGTRRAFFWRCTKGYELLQGRNYGERTIMAPPECDAFKQWGAGIR